MRTLWLLWGIAIVACGRDAAPREVSTSRVDELRTAFVLRGPDGTLGPAIPRASETTLESEGASHYRATALTAPRGTRRSAQVLVPVHGDGSVHIEDDETSLGVAFRLRGAAPSVGTVDGGVVVHRHALPGADLVRRTDLDGVEDFAVFEARPEIEELAYELALSKVAGLRLVSSSLELLDAHGTPRLRVAPPWLVDGHGERHAAQLGIDGCAYDTSEAPPWDRAVTAPGAPTCTLRVSWSSSAYPVLVDPGWTTTGSLASDRSSHSATALANGRALIAGGSDGAGALATTEIFDVTTGTFAMGPTMSKARSSHSAVRLPSGKVLVAAGSSGASSAEIYDPAAGTFAAPITMLPGMNVSASTLLKSGKVLLVGPNTSAQQYDEVTGMFTAAGSPTKNPSKALSLQALASGKAVLFHGIEGGPPMQTAELYDPGTNTFGGLTTLSSSIGPSMVVLPNDKVLISGGYALFTHEGTNLWDPTTGVITNGADMSVQRAGHASKVLHNGKTLILGGAPKLPRAVEVYDWKNTVFTSTPASALEHGGASTVTVLASGKVLVVDPTKTSEVYEPTRLNGEACVANDGCESGFCADGVCCDRGCTGACEACNLDGALRGKCSFVTGSPRPPRAACDGAGACAGACDGKNAGCAYPGPSSVCGNACAANKQTTSRCNGEGKCIEANATSCHNLVCADERTCKSTCAGNGDCLDGFVCVNGACVVGTTCADDHTAKPVVGALQDCTPYRCAAGCLTSCKSIDDCAAPNACNAAGECIPPPPESDGGCAAAGTRRGGTNGALAILGIILTTLATRARRLRRRFGSVR